MKKSVLFYFFAVILLMMGCLACNSDDPDDNCTIDLVIMDKKIQSPQWLAAVMDNIENQQTNRTCSRYEVYSFKYQEKEYILVGVGITPFFYTSSGIRVKGEFEKELESAWIALLYTHNYELLCTAFYGMCPNPGPGVERGFGESSEMQCGCTEGWLGEKEEYPGELSWVYPIKTGGGSWEGWEELNKLPSREERIEALQIPEEILSSLPTEELVILCMMINSFTAYFATSLEWALDTMKKDFNCFREVCQREDALEAMLTVYRRVHAVQDPKKSGWQMEIDILEILLGCYQSKNNLKEEYLKILQHLVCGYENRARYYCGDNIDYLGCGSITNTFARAKMLSKIDEKFVEQLPFRDQNPILIDGISREIVICMRLLNDFSCKYIYLSNL